MRTCTRNPNLIRAGTTTCPPQHAYQCGVATTTSYRFNFFFFPFNWLLIQKWLGAGFTLPYWDFSGSTMVTGNYIRLTPDIQSRSGCLWNSQPVMSQNWEVNVNFKVSGKGKELFGDGLAIWYAKERLVPGAVFGSKDNFFGLAIILDTYSNHNGPHNVSASHD